MAIVIAVKPEKLSDGSEVFNVFINRDLQFAATTEKDANALADKIAAAVNEHSVDIAYVEAW